MKKIEEFAKFSEIQLKSLDNNSEVPFLCSLADSLKLSYPQRILLCMLYSAYYSVASAWTAFCYPFVKNRTSMPPAGIHIDRVRKNLYGVNMLDDHLRFTYEIPDLTDWIDSIAISWPILVREFNRIPHNGEKTSFDAARVITHVLQIRLEPTEMEVLKYRSTRKSLKTLDLPPETKTLNILREEISTVYGKLVPISSLKGLLDDWVRIVEGKFYPGMNIDCQQTHIHIAERYPHNDVDPLWATRKAVYSAQHLGELQCRYTTREERMTLYRDKGLILPSDTEELI